MNINRELTEEEIQKILLVVFGKSVSAELHEDSLSITTYKTKFPKTNIIKESKVISRNDLTEILITFARASDFYITSGLMRSTKEGVWISRIESRGIVLLFTGTNSMNSTLKAIRWLQEHNFNKDILDG